MAGDDSEKEANAVPRSDAQRPPPRPDSEPEAVLHQLESSIRELDKLPWVSLFKLLRLLRTRTARRIVSIAVGIAVTAFAAGAVTTDKIGPVWKALKSRVLGGPSPADSRVDLFEHTPSFIHFSRQAEKEVFAAGPNLLWVVQNARSFLMDEMAAGKRVRVHLLIMADKLPQKSDSPNPGVALIQRYGGEGDFASALGFSLENFRHWQRDARQRNIPLEIRVAEIVPITVTIVDADTSDGRLQLRPLPYRMPGERRPTVEIHRRDAPKAFEEYVRSFRALWAGASPLE